MYLCSVWSYSDNSINILVGYQFTVSFVPGDHCLASAATYREYYVLLVPGDYRMQFPITV
jgi:hypothetical protein